MSDSQPGGMPPEMMAAIARTGEAALCGDRHGEAIARRELGIRLIEFGRYGAAVAELTKSADLFAELGMLDQAARAVFYAGGAHGLSGEYRAGLLSLAAAAAHLDQLAARSGHLGDGLDELRLRVEACWLEFLRELAKDSPADDAIVTDAVQRCDRVLALTQPPVGPVAVQARSIACFERAHLLARGGDYKGALPSAREAAETASRSESREARSRGRYMRMIMAEALTQLGEQAEAGDHFVRAASLAITDDDALTIDGALLGLGLLYRRQQGRLAEGLRDLPGAFAAAGSPHREARCRAVLAKAMEMTPDERDLGRPVGQRSLDIVEEYVRAAQLFNELGEVGKEADARYSAGFVLSRVAGLRPEHRERAMELLGDAERLFRQVVNWHGVGATLLSQAEVLNWSHPGIARDDARVDALLEEAVGVFRRAERPAEEAGAIRTQARLTGLHSGPTERFVELCLAAFEANERGRASRLLPTERESDDNRKSYSFTFLGSDVWDFVRMNSADSRCGDLVWGLEQAVKGRSLRDLGRSEPDLWQLFLTKDDRLRELTEQLERAQFRLESVLRRRDSEAADAARSAVEAVRRLQRHRLEDVADDSEIELGLASIPAVNWRKVQATLAPGEMYVGLVACGGRDRYLRTLLTSTDARFDPVEALGLLPLLVRERNGERLDGADRARLRRRADDLLGLPASGGRRPRDLPRSSSCGRALAPARRGGHPASAR